MRQVISISLPKQMADEIHKEVKRGKYANTSNFFRDLFMMYKNDELLFRDIRASEDDIQKGRVHRLTTLEDLMK